MFVKSEIFLLVTNIGVTVYSSVLTEFTRTPDDKTSGCTVSLLRPKLPTKKTHQTTQVIVSLSGFLGIPLSLFLFVETVWGGLRDIVLTFRIVKTRDGDSSVWVGWVGVYETELLRAEQGNFEGISSLPCVVVYRNLPSENLLWRKFLE